jgi:hypothetical protein
MIPVNPADGRDGGIVVEPTQENAELYIAVS